MLRASAVLAMFTRLLLALGEVRANWGDWQWWPWWLVDYVAAGLLILAGGLTLRRSDRGPLLLGIGWAFTAGMVWMSLAGNIADGVDTDRNARLVGSYIGLLSFLLGTSALGLVLTVMGARNHPNP